MAAIVKTNIDKATVRQLFKAVVRAADEIHETLFLHGQTKRRLQIWPIVHGSEFYVPNQFNNLVQVTKNGHPDVRGWADQELVNGKETP